MLAPMLWLAMQAAPPTLSEALARGDEHYARRAEGASGARADPSHIDHAIVEYRRAAALDPDSIGARWRLLRALFFRATFCGAPEPEQSRLFEEAREVSDEAVARVEKGLGRRKGATRLAALRQVKDAARLYFWAAVSWGEWAQRRSRLAAARRGAGARIRDLAQTVIALDPELEEGGGYRILGRLHDLSPRLPFVTGWVSREAALDNLRRAHGLAPSNTVNQLFLAEAILRHQPSGRKDAIEMLRRLARARPSAAYPVEDAHFAELARRRLAELR